MGENAFITAGNASQLSDGASACIVMSSKKAEKLGIEPLGIYRGMAVSGLEPDEMGVGRFMLVPKLLKKVVLKSMILTYGNSLKHLLYKLFTVEISLEYQMIF